MCCNTWCGDGDSRFIYSPTCLRSEHVWLYMTHNFWVPPIFLCSAAFASISLFALSMVADT